MCRFESRTDLDQWTLADAGAVAGGFVPGVAVFDEFGPVGEEAALDGFDGVDGTAAGKEEVALCVFGFAQAEAVAGADDVAALKLGWGEGDEACGAEEIVFGEVDPALLLAALGAALDAGELKRA